ncbi:MAG TPA: hypothetical protein VFQ53_38820 [Kofleriaceae bacterium]|nr:hypothetical protein [Kofleriaceae bacterium]
MKRLLVIAMLVACGSEEATTTVAPETIAPPKDAIAKTTESGPVKATVKVWPAKPTLGDPIYVRLEVDAPPGISIDAPFQEAGDQRLGRFRVVGFTRDSHRTDKGGMRQEQTYTLEAQTSGKHRVPPLRLEMLDARGSAAHGSTDKPAAQELLTEEVPLDVAPVPTERASAELKPAAGALDPDVGGTSWLLVAGIAFVVAAVGIGSVVGVRSLRTRRRIEQQRSAYDEAIAHLTGLQARGAPDAAAADAWFVELSAIVRRYLEQRYEIRAPELTTEEFLQVATSRSELGEDHRALLSSFLDRCDRVKFAGYRPDASESLATLEAARTFVEDTRLREPAAIGRAA